MGRPEPFGLTEDPDLKLATTDAHTIIYIPIEDNQNSAKFKPPDCTLSYSLKSEASQKKLYPADTYSKENLWIDISDTSCYSNIKARDMHGNYIYTLHLLALDSCRPVNQVELPTFLEQVTTPLIANRWEESLQDHADRNFASYITSGIQHGFRVGYQYMRYRHHSARSNMPSALANPEVVQEYIMREVQAGRVLGPIDPNSIPEFQISRFGVIPKSAQPGHWRLILDLSHPKHFSINDGTDPQLCSLAYLTVHDAVQQVLNVGRGALLAKIDIKQAFRNAPVHPQDRHLLGMMWSDQLFIDTVLPFGLRSAPKIFCAIADALEWILYQRGISFSLDYLDDLDGNQ